MWPFANICLFLMAVQLTVSGAWKDYDVRFEDPSVTEGGVQIFFQEDWHSLCRLSLLYYVANTFPQVMCSSMGLSSPTHTRTLQRSLFKAHSKAMVVHFKCTGQEESLQQCMAISPRPKSACRQVQIACKGENKKLPASIKCQENTFDISINVGAFRRYFPEVDPDKLTLDDGTCGVSNGSRPSINVSAAFNGCGTYVEGTSQAFVYTNHLGYTDKTGSRTKLQTITCSFPRKVEAKQEIRAIPKSVLVVTGQRKFLVTMAVYKDKHLKKEVTLFPFNPTEQLYIHLSLNKAGERFGISPQDCNAVSSLESTETSPLISDGCPAAKGTTLLASSPKEVLLSLKLEDLKTNGSNKIYFVCSVTVCLTAGGCTRKCSSSSSTYSNRKRRDVGIPLGSASAFKGPILLNTVQKPQGVLDSAWMVGVCGVGILTSGVIVGLLGRKIKHM